jgi:hypothetical protein
MRDDTALFVDARVSFSHLLPGRPTLGMLRPNEPADAVVHLQDAPVTLRYRVESPSFLAGSAAELAHGTAERFGAWRTGAPVEVEFANASWHASWSVEAAAITGYETFGEHGPVREELFVLVKQGLVLLVGWSYPAGFVSDPAYATFASVAEATLVWDAARFDQRGRVWPEGHFFGPGLYGAPRPKYNEASRQLGAAPVTEAERAQLLAVLSGVVSGAGAPWVRLSREVVQANQRAILGATQAPALRAFLEQAFLDVETAHDLRGLAILLGRALDGALRPSLPPPLVISR